MIGFVVFEYILGRAQKFKAQASDNLLDLVGFGLLAALTQPTIVLCVTKLGTAFAPQYKNALIDQPWWVFALLFLVFDDMLQYWWHRCGRCIVRTTARNT